MNLDPKNTTDYLGPNPNNEVVEICMNQISQPATPDTEAITLHYLRLMSQTRCGQAEAKVFQQIAEDSSRIRPTREWAWLARCRADGTKRSSIMEAARDEPNAYLRRALVVSLKGNCGSGKIKSFVQLLAKRYEENVPTAEWVMAA
jgi:hypothetical protein